MANKRSSSRSHGPGQFRSEVSSFLADLDEFAEQLATPAAPTAVEEAEAPEPAAGEPPAPAAQPAEPAARVAGPPQPPEPAATAGAEAESLDESVGAISPEPEVAPESPASPEPPGPPSEPPRSPEVPVRGPDILELRRPSGGHPAEDIEFESVDLHLVELESGPAALAQIAASSQSRAGDIRTEIGDESPPAPLAGAEIAAETDAGQVPDMGTTTAEAAAPSWPAAAPNVDAEEAAEAKTAVPGPREPSWQPSPVTPDPEDRQSQTHQSVPDIRVVPVQSAGAARSMPREPQRPPRWAPFPLTGATAAAAPPQVDRPQVAGPVVRPAAPVDPIPGPAWPGDSLDSRRQPPAATSEADTAAGPTVVASTQGRPWALATAMEPLPPLAPPPARPSIPTHAEANGVLGNNATNPPQGLSPWVYIGLALLIGGVLVVLLVMGLHHH